jgi:hypothetical protein
MKEKNSVTEANNESDFVIILLYFSGLSLASLLLLALLACFGLLVSAGVLPQGSCPETDPLDHSVLLPHPTDCSKFFICSNGVPIEVWCPPGLYFNNELKVCDLPENVKCVNCKLSRLYLTPSLIMS